MTFSASGFPESRLRLPLWIWFLALALGFLLAAVSLNYAPNDRLNILWLWLLWAGFPLLGSMVSLGFLLFGRNRPWLFRWRGRSFNWYPNADQRLHMLWLLQCFWLLLGLGMLLGFWALLLLTDLAFGWSSTLLDNSGEFLKIVQFVSLPWQAVWPEAVPSAGLMETTRFIRIEPESRGIESAGDWWRFLMASLICYNLLPRVLLGLGVYLRWRQLSVALPSLTQAGSSGHYQPASNKLRESSHADWLSASELSWELPGASGHGFGLGPWEADKQALEAVLEQQPQKLLWRVNASRSPVGELADLVQMARECGVEEQGLVAVSDSGTRRERHIASWRNFCQRQQLAWVVS